MGIRQFILYLLQALAAGPSDTIDPVCIEVDIVGKNRRGHQRFSILFFLNHGMFHLLFMIDIIHNAHSFDRLTVFPIDGA